MKDPLEGYIRLPIKLVFLTNAGGFQRRLRPVSAWAVASCGRQWLEMALL